MKRSDIALANLNDDVREQIAGGRLGFCKVLAWAFAEKLSVVAQYDPPSEYLTLAGSSDKHLLLSCDVDDYYYGVSPCLDAKELVRLVSSYGLQTMQNLHDYIRKNGKWFSVHRDQFKFLEPLAAYIVVCMASHFGIRMKIRDDYYGQLRAQLQADGYSGDGIDAFMSAGDSVAGYRCVKIKGCPTDVLLKCLKQYSYVKVDVAARERGDGSGSDGTVWEMTKSNEGVSIDEVYRHVELIEGRVFYSGVLLKPTKLEFIDGPHENDKVISLRIHFERSTYGTVCALDRNLTAHPVFSADLRRSIIEMLQQDDRQKDALRVKLDEAEKTLDKADYGTPEHNDQNASRRMIGVVNDYLGKSLNVNQIGVSANVVTREGALLLGRRSDLNIDAGTLYPGVNGNAEVADRNVSFYGQSVYEDYPTIRIDDDRIDFFGEIGREAYAEMKLGLSKQEWNCRGVMLSGNMPDAGAHGNNGNTAAGALVYAEPLRRLHFNLLFEHDTSKTFHEIETSSIMASEAFETNCYSGVRVECAKNRIAYCCGWLCKRVRDIVTHKDFIEAVVAMVVFSVSISAASSKQSAGLIDTLVELLTGVVTLSLSCLIVIYTVVRMTTALYGYVRDFRKVHRVRIYSDMSYDDVNKRIKKAMNSKGKGVPSFHPVAYASLRMFVDNKICASFFPEDRR